MSYNTSDLKTCEICGSKYYTTYSRAKTSKVCSRQCNGENTRRSNAINRKNIGDLIREKTSVNDETGCWEWIGKIRSDGYALIKFNKRQQSASRFSYEAFIGPIPHGMFVCHHCDNRKCCNPDHLFSGTPLDNTRDMDRKGRGRRNGKTGEANAKAKLTETIAMAIFKAEGPHPRIAKQYGISASLVSAIKLKQRWKHLHL